MYLILTLYYSIANTNDVKTKRKILIHDLVVRKQMSAILQKPVICLLLLSIFSSLGGISNSSTINQLKCTNMWSCIYHIVFVSILNRYIFIIFLVIKTSILFSYRYVSKLKKKNNSVIHKCILDNIPNTYNGFRYNNFIFVTKLPSVITNRITIGLI